MLLPLLVVAFVCFWLGVLLDQLYWRYTKGHQ